ncbi:MAG: hypothetical protein FWG74_03415 [Planctomycetes bacterium]|nr:hypothetical protein [Planctomycetota bacterium]
MSASEDEKLIFGRYTREECGLPPAGADRPGWQRFIPRFIGLVVVLLAAGWTGGTAAARWREDWMASLPARVARADAGERAELLARGGLYAAALPNRPRVLQNLVFAILTAAERAPRRLGYYGSLVHIFDGLVPDSGGDPAGEFGLWLVASGVYLELGEYAKAFASLERADAALERLPDAALARSHRLLLVNAQAYCLATAPEGSGRDSGRAVHLAELMITSRDELASGGNASDSAAFMDTLATAWFAAGDTENAIAAQRLALGLADSEGLVEYLKHYDDFVQALKYTGVR